MCRLLTYNGPSMIMENLIVHANHSLIAQSLSSTKRSKPLNGDGFGVGWYPLHDDPEPGVFRSIEPAWRNHNLRQIAGKIKSRCFFAHVRDASAGMHVSRFNCHPFSYGRFLWMHNGRLDQFEKIKKPLINSLSDRAYINIQGTTDSEYAFALFLDYMDFKTDADLHMMKNGLNATLKHIMELRKEYGATTPSYMNFAISNGKITLVTRLSSSEEAKPESLFYAYGRYETDASKQFRLRPNSDVSQDVAIIASEPLTDWHEDWIKVERHSMIIVDESNKVSVETIPVPFQEDL